MGDEIELITDGDGLAVIGQQTAVERFLDSLGLLGVSQDLGLHRLQPVLRAGEAVAKAGSEIAANSGRWVKLTEESAERIKEFGLMDSKTPGIKHAMVGDPGAIKSWLQIDMRPGSILTSPALLAGAAGLMAQISSQNEMKQITEYLAKIDKKLDAVLRNQNYTVWATMDGAGSVVKDAIAMRETKGRVDSTTWSKVQGLPETIASSQRYAVLRLSGVADDLENATKMGALAKTAEDAQTQVRVWLGVLARCFELQDAMDVLELDRVLDASPDEVDLHRLGLKDARQARRADLLGVTTDLLRRMDGAVETASSRVLLHLPSHRAVMDSINQVGLALDDFHKPLGVDPVGDSLEATRWWVAARDPKQWKTAGAEAGRKALVGVAVVGLTAVGIVAAAAAAAVAKDASKADE